MTQWHGSLLSAILSVFCCFLGVPKQAPASDPLQVAAAASAPRMKQTLKSALQKFSRRTGRAVHVSDEAKTKLGWAVDDDACFSDDAATADRAIEAWANREKLLLLPAIDDIGPWRLVSSRELESERRVEYLLAGDLSKLDAERHALVPCHALVRMETRSAPTVAVEINTSAMAGDPDCLAAGFDLLLITGRSREVSKLVQKARDLDAAAIREGKARFIPERDSMRQLRERIESLEKGNPPDRPAKRPGIRSLRQRIEALETGKSVPTLRQREKIQTLIDRIELLEKQRTDSAPAEKK